MADPFTDLLSDYLDDEELSLEERHRIEQHLAECGECRATLAELREVALQASALVDTPPTVDLWPGVAARIGGVEQAVRHPFRRSLRSFRCDRLPGGFRSPFRSWSPLVSR